MGSDLVALSTNKAVSAASGLMTQALVCGVGTCEHDWLLLCKLLGAVNFFCNHSRFNHSLNDWLLVLLMNNRFGEFFVNYRAFVLFLNNLLIAFVNNRFRNIMNEFFVCFVDYWLMNLTDLLRVNNRLMVFVDNVLMLLMNDVFVVLMNDVLMVLVNHISVMLLYNWLVDVCFNPCL